MKPYYEQDGITIYHGDCREMVPSLASVDLVLTDIPYGEVNRPSGGLRDLDKGVADVPTASVELISAMVAITGANTAYLFCATEQVSGLRLGLRGAGYTTRLGVWEKSNPSPMNGEHLWLSSVECCVFARRSGATFTEHCASPVWRGPTDSEGWGHPTPKPRWLFDRLLLASSRAGDTCLDPFMGSGTTLVAAKNLGRKAIGVEIEERYCEIAAQRLSQQVLDFGEAA